MFKDKLRKVLVNIDKDTPILAGYFHAWGNTFTEYDAGPGNYSVAIVELESGDIKLVFPECVTFITELDEV